MLSPAFIFQCEIDLALTYSLRHPKLAISCARVALMAAVAASRPDLAYRANTLIAAIGGVL